MRAMISVHRRGIVQLSEELAIVKKDFEAYKKTQLARIEQIEGKLPK